MPMVKVWNDNIYPHTETFKGEVITIPPGEHIVMEWEEAIEFKGQFTGMKLLGNDTPDPRGFKKIRVDRPSEPIFKEAPLVNPATGEKFLTKAELEESLKQFAHLRVTDADAEAQAKSGSSVDAATVKALMERIAALESQVKVESAEPKRKPGRPKLFKKEAQG